MSYIGKAMARTEDHRLLTAGGTYTEDLPVPDCLHVVLVRSPVAHARLTGIDTDAALAAPGVVAVVTARDVDVAHLAPEVGTVNQDMTQPLLAGDVVRYVGEPVAAIVATGRAAATDAAGLVEVGYHSLPPLVDPMAALRDEVVLHAPAGTNAALRLTFARPAGRGDIMDGCPVVVRQRLVNQRVAASPLETRAAVASWTEADGLTLHASAQAPHLWRGQFATALGLPEDRVRVITPDVGGAFGSKGFAGREEILLGWLARRLRRAVRWSETRTENLTAGNHGRAQLQEAEIGGTPDGRVLAYRLAVVQDVGAYPRVGAVLPFWTRTMLTGPYAIGRAKFTATSVVTTTAPVGSYRGAGQPEAVAALERMMDRYAVEIGMDPAEVRRRNLIGREEFPFTTLTRASYDSGDYELLLDRVLAAADYAALRADQQARREAGDVRQRGVGLSVFVELTGADARSEYASVELHPDGRTVVQAGTCGHGQGHQTAWAMLVAEALGVPVERVRLVQGDTGAVASGGGTGGSRSLQTGGLAVRAAAHALVEQARPRAAQLLGRDASQLVFNPGAGRFHAAGEPCAGCGWSELTAETGPLRATATYSPTGATAAAGAHVAVVEVDTETGQVTLVRLVAVDDAGVILNPVLADGQVHGGLAQGIGQALCEEVRYTPDGEPLHPDLAAYAMIGAAQLPFFETEFVQTPSPVNELGVKGIGESGATGVPAAVLNAVIDAVAHLGVRHIDMPATPEHVWRAIRAARHDGVTRTGIEA